MATLINGNGNPRIYAAQDADLIAALAGDITGIAQIGNKFAATAVDANTISVADGVIVTKEGRRIQLDAGSTDMFVIPTGTTGVTNYYIIGYKLTTQSDDSQIAETFVQLMSSSSETITEDTFRSGATDVYVSLYRVQQNGVNLGTITGLLPELTSISQLNNDLTDIESNLAKNNLDSSVNLKSYTSDKYTFPSDGYVTLRCAGDGTNGDTGSYNLYGADELHRIFEQVHVGVTETSGENVFVRKGMKLQMVTAPSNTNSAVTFTPLI